MSSFYQFIIAAAIAGLTLIPAQQAAAQLDTLVVEWDSDGDFLPDLDALRDTILADTLEDGSHPANRVYKLRRGGYYWSPNQIDNVGFHLRIVGEQPTADAGPAVLQNVDDGAGFVSARMFGGQSSITLKNLYIMGQDDLGSQGTRYQPCQIDASNSRFVFDNCIFERSNFAIVAFTATNNDIFFTNCSFRNLVSDPITQQWEGRGVSIWADQDTVVFENNTFFNLHMTAIQIEQGSTNYLLVNHNTFVNIGRSINTGNWFQEAYWGNNLVYNGFWHSEGISDLSGGNRDPRATTSGLFSIGALPSKYGPEIARKIVIANTSSFLDPAFTDYYSDSLLVQPFINPVTAEDFINEYEAMIIQDTVWADPGLVTTTPEIYDAMIASIDGLRQGMDGSPYFWMIPEDPATGGRCHTCPSWPLPEDFSYTNTALLTAGTDGLPLGDLNWFPNEKAAYEADRDAMVATLTGIGPTPPSFAVSGAAEAELGTLGGDAAIEPFEGFAYYQIDGGGFMQWDFELAEGGEYDLNVWTHMRGNTVRGQRVIVNGVSLHECYGYGEYIWDTNPGGPCENVHVGMEINDWTWTKIIQSEINEAGALTLPAGANTIRIESSWGFQNFAGIDLLEPGTDNVIKSLRAQDVNDHELVIPVGQGKPWTPSEFNSVGLNANGSITWMLTAPSDGTYRLRVFYQNYAGQQSGQIDAGGETVPVTFDSNTDSTGLDLLSDSFSLTAGSQTVSLTGSQVRIDYIQLLQEIEIVASVSGSQLPDGFAVYQNYPNPFNPSTNIRFDLGKPSDVKLTVFNVLGQKVATLVDGPLEAGVHIMQWDAGKVVASGVYFFRLEAAGFKVNKRMLLLK